MCIQEKCGLGDRARAFWSAHPVIRACLVVLGGVLMHITLGTIYTLGNMIPYITSYLRRHTDLKTLTNTQASWIAGINFTGKGVFTVLGGLMEQRLGPRLALLICGSIMSLGVMATYWTIQRSFWGVLLTYGVLYGPGVGAYGVCLACAIRWWPRKAGMVSGIVVAGFGSGSFVFTEIQTAYINPNNEVPHEEGATGQLYFDQDDMLDRVPSCFLMLGGTYLLIQLIAVVLVSNPPSSQEEWTLLGQRKTPPAERLNMDEDDNNQGNEGVHPKQMLRTKSFWLMWASFFFNTLPMYLFGTLYKAYGQTFIQDDHFLAWTGAAGSIGGTLGRLALGATADRFHFKAVLLLTSASIGIFTLTVNLAPQAG